VENVLFLLDEDAHYSFDGGNGVLGVLLINFLLLLKLGEFSVYRNKFISALVDVI